MKLIGLTGGCGMGKSTSAALLRERGIPLIDTDVLAREIVEPGQPALEEIRKAFGDSVIDVSGLLAAGLAGENDESEGIATQAPADIDD